jgi:hypothetical protein
VVRARERRGGPDDLTSLRADYLASLHAISDAIGTIDRAMGTFHAKLDDARRRIVVDQTVSPVIIDIKERGVVEERREVSRAIRDFEAAVQHMRGTSIRVLVAEGMTITEAARTFDISTQMARRLYRVAEAASA